MSQDSRESALNGDGCQATVDTRLDTWHWSRGLRCGQGDSGGTSGLLKLWGSSKDGRIGQILDKLFDLMICYNVMEIYLKYVPLSVS